MNIIDFNITELNVIDRKEPDFSAAVQAVFDYLLILPLSHEQNNHLVKLLTAQVQATEQNAFYAGFDLGIKVMKYIDVKEFGDGRK